MASNIERYKKVCRACLSADEHVKDLFSTQINDIDLDQMFSQCVGSPVHQDDGLPSFMCQSCLDNLQIAYNFQELCRASEQALRNAICKVEPGIEIGAIKYEVTEEEIFAEAIVPDVVNSDDDVNSSLICNRNVIEDTIRHDDGVGYTANSKPNDQSKGHLRINCNEEQQPGPNNQISRDFKPSTFKCLECDEAFASPKMIVIHITKKHIQKGRPRYKCEHCPLTTSQLKMLSDHVKCHAEQKNSKCDVCRKTFETLGHLSHHKNKKHSNVKPYVCPVCQKGNS